MAKLSIVIPCYFNEGNIPVTMAALVDNEKYFPKGAEFEYILVDDGSGDNTLQELLRFRAQFPRKVKVIKLVRNFGSYQAILAGLQFATGDCTSIIAADLQDSPELMPEMFTYWQQGIPLVIAYRQLREDKSTFSELFHLIMRKLFFPTAPPGGFDYVLFSRALREKVLVLPEARQNIFYALLRLSPGYQGIPYVRRGRQIGRSRWTWCKKAKLLYHSIAGFAFPRLMYAGTKPPFIIERIYEAQ